MQNIVAWNGWFREFSDHIVKAESVADIRAAKAAGKTTIVLGMQNTSAFEDKIGYVEIPKTLGVGIGTDFTQCYDQPFFDWITHDKGFGRRLTSFGEIVNPDGLREIRDFPNVADAMAQAGWSASKIEKVLGQNWLKLLGEVWG